MDGRQPSRTAWSAANHRGAHQLLEGGRVFADPLAVRILGVDPNEVRADAEAHPDRLRMRLFIACRHRYADDVVAAAAVRGVRQVVVVGAGLDTTAYRPRSGGQRLRVFEVDHPATQAWKLEQLARVGLVPATDVAYVGVDLARDDLLARMRAAGFEDSSGAVFVWLGVVPYLTAPAFWDTLAAIAGVPGAEVVFDYSEPAAARTGPARAELEVHASRVAAMGEPWLTFFEPDVLARGLVELGVDQVEDLGVSEFAHRYLGAPADAPRRPGPHLVHASFNR